MRTSRSRYLTCLSTLLLLAASTARAQSTGDLVIVSNPPGADIRIDGESAGRAPVTRHLMPGDHLVEASWPGQPPVSELAKVLAGRSNLLQLHLPGAAPTPVAAPPSAPPPPAAPPQAAPPPPPPAAPPPPMPVPGQPLPEQTPDASGGGQAQAIAGDVKNPLHPENRHMVRYAANIGIFCPMYTTGDGYTMGASFTGCGFYAHPIELDTHYSDFHIDLMAGGAFLAAAGFGFGVGSPYVQLGGGTGHFAIAFRTNLDFIGGDINGSAGGGKGGVPTPLLDAFMGGVITPGVNVSYAVQHSMTLQGRLGLGFMLGGTVPAGGVGSDPLKFYADFHMELTVGVRL
jgi:hypothetical protein